MLGGDSSRKTQLAALAALGLSHVIDFPARLLSAGQRRRVALARLLVAERPLWLLDVRDDAASSSRDTSRGVKNLKAFIADRRAWSLRLARPSSCSK